MKIETLLIHRSPFLFVDDITKATEKHISGIMTFAKEEHRMLLGSFPESNIIPGMILMESMAQCGGAGIKKMKLLKGLYGLAMLENVNFYSGAEYEKQIVYNIENLLVNKRMIKQQGKAFQHETLIMQ